MFPFARNSAAVLTVLTIVLGLSHAQDDQPSAAKPITYQDVLKLLENKTDEQEILNRLEKSPTIFTLDARQVDELKKAGASEKVLQALAGKRPGATPGSDITDFAIILDCSGSMIDKTREGPSKMEVAKKVVAELIGKVPNGRRLTFLVYGHDLEQGCKAIKVVRPLSEIDDAGKAEVRNFIKTLQPVGHTPIAGALQIAGQELAKNKAACGLILITDGMETCHGDPNAEAARLAKDLNLAFGLHVVGFDVDPKELEAVKEIARAGKGKYYDARSAAGLTEVLKGLEEKLAETAPPARADRQVVLEGTKAKPGTFFHDAPLVTPGDLQGQLPFMAAHYYQVLVRKGQELRVIGKVQKAPYKVSNPQDRNDIQTFSITIYDQSLATRVRATIDVPGNPSQLQTWRALWQAPEDTLAYVVVAASDTHNPKGKHGFVYPEDLQVAPSAYTLTLKLAGDASSTGEGPAPLPRLNTTAGNGFGQAGELTIPGLANSDLKLREVSFFKAKVNKGDALRISLAAQKPLYCVENDFFPENNKATYTLTVYDDDQVEVTRKVLDIMTNPPDAQTATIDWTPALSGVAYFTVSCENTGNKVYAGKGYPQPGPGRVAIQITKSAATTAR
jgi:hypothetical protein